MGLSVCMPFERRYDAKMGIWESIKRALGPKRYTIGGFSALLGGLYAPLQAWLKNVGVTFLPEVHFVASTLIAFLFCLALFFAFRLRDLEAKLSPNLTVSDPVISRASVGPPVRNRSPNQYVRTNFFHVVVANLGNTPITNCAVHILGLTRHQADEKDAIAEISNPINLVTASSHEKSVTIYPELPQHFDLAHSPSANGKWDLAPAIKSPHALPTTFFEHEADYDFRIVITGDNTPSVTSTIRINWKGSWDSMEIKRI